MNKTRMGIYSIGTYLPPIVRKNDWWPEELVKVWRERQARSITRSVEEPEDPPTEGMRVTLQAMAQFKNDPFEGAVERHVMPDDMKTAPEVDVPAEFAAKGQFMPACPSDVQALYTKIWTDLQK